jgi:hypothetical protein
MPCRIAQERVPAASNVGSRDVTWVIDGLPELFFAIVPLIVIVLVLELVLDFLYSHQLGGTGQILPLHVFWTCHAGSRRSASRVQCRVAQCDMGDRWPARAVAINRQIPGPLVTVIQQRGRDSTRCRRFTSHLSPPFASFRGPIQEAKAGAFAYFPRGPACRRKNFLMLR